MEYCYTDTAQKMTFPIKDFFGKYDQIRGLLRIWSHLPKKSLMENSNFCVVEAWHFLWLFFFFSKKKKKKAFVAFKFQIASIFYFLKEKDHSAGSFCLGTADIYLGRCQTSTMELLCEYSWRLNDANYFYTKAPS